MCTGVCLCLSVCQRANIRWGAGLGGRCLQAFGEPGEKAPASEPFFRLEGLGTERGLRQGWSWN